ncbi:transcriptase subunit beta, partial [Neisseria sp. P0016.S008]
NGTARFSSQMRYVANNKGELVVIGRTCEVVIHDDIRSERERHKVPYGAILLVQDGESIKAGQTLATWDPHTRPMITEHAGMVKFETVEVGFTVAKQTDDVTGLSTLV